MTEKDLISIVIPVYNVQDYLNKCLDSVLNQTYNNIEIILVDDGSTDKSGEICDKYNEKDNRIQVIHKQNGGLSDARNVGIKNARGKYITFVDSDDYLELDYIEYLYNLIKKYNTKMSICSYYIENIKGKRSDSGEGYKEELMSTEDALYRMLVEKGYSVSACAKMYELKLFDDVCYPVGKLCEDNGTTYKLIEKCEYIAYGNLSKYIYLKRDNSIMNSEFNIKKMDLITLTDEMYSYLKPKYPSLTDALNRRKNYTRFSILRQLVTAKNGNKELENEMAKYILTNRKEIMNNKATPKRDKIALIILQISGIFGFAISW